MQAKKSPLICFYLSALLLLAPACSIEKFALKKTAGLLSGTTGGTVFSGDDDPELVGDALPFAIKFYESLLASIPDHRGLRLQTGRLYIIYAGAFIQSRANMMTRQELEEKEALLQRSKKLYLRGRDLLLPALLQKNPRLLKLLNERRYTEALAPFGKGDLDFLYWTAAGWVSAYALDPFDMKLGLTLPQAAALMNRVLELDPNYGQGAIHNFFILYYGSLPSSLGGDLGKAREHFNSARTLSSRSDTSYLISLATTVCVKEQNRQEFESLLREVLAFDIETSPETRLVNVLNQRKAKWLLDHIDDYFLPPGEDGGIENSKEGKKDSSYFNFSLRDDGLNPHRVCPVEPRACGFEYNYKPYGQGIERNDLSCPDGGLT